MSLREDNRTFARTTYAASLVTTPQRFSVWNASANQEVVAQMNPTTFDESIGAEYEKLSTQGQSHQRQHYRNTSNYVVSMELRWRAFSEDEYAEMIVARHQLLSWCYPWRTAGQRQIGPPRLIATWPSVFSMSCYLMSCKIKHERFGLDGGSLAFTASVVFEEARDRFLSSSQVADVIVVRGLEANDEVEPVANPKPASAPKPQGNPKQDAYIYNKWFSAAALSGLSPEMQQVAAPYVEAAGKYMQQPASKSRTANLANTAAMLDAALIHNSAYQG